MKIINIFNFLKKDYFYKKNLYLKINDRNLKITSNMIGFKISVYNGKYYIPLKITSKMVGKIIGSFSFSKNILLLNMNKNYKKKNNKKKNKK